MCSWRTVNEAATPLPKQITVRSTPHPEAKNAFKSKEEIDRKMCGIVAGRCTAQYHPILTKACVASKYRGILNSSWCCRTGPMENGFEA